MFDTIFQSLFAGEYTPVISVQNFLICVGTSLVIGIILALCYMAHARYTKSFVATLALLPAVVCVVIMMVNGNVGAGVAVAGAFSLVRFRSVPGTAEEIVELFLAMGAGLIAGMGYLAYALLFSLVLGGATLLYSKLDFGVSKNRAQYRVMRITIPEDLDYTGIFDELFREYTTSWELVSVKTTNMGSLFRLTYEIRLRDPAREKEFLDKLRCRNGNLEISISSQETPAAGL